MRDSERFNFSLSQTEGRLKYKTLVEETKENGYEQVTIFPMIETNHGKKKSVLQLKDDQIVGKYPIIADAPRYTGINYHNRMLNSKPKTSGGFEWKYED